MADRERVRDWLKRGAVRRKETAEQAEAYEQLVANYERRVDGKLAEREDTTPRYNQQRTLLRRFSVYADVSGEPAPELPVVEEEEPKPKDTGHHTWNGRAAADRRNNFLYALWSLRYDTSDPGNVDLEGWNEVVAARAVLRLLTAFPARVDRPSIGEELLASLYRPHERHTMPKREDARRFLERRPVPRHVGNHLEVERFMAELSREVPGIKRAIYRLLAAYRRAVLVQWRVSGRPEHAGPLPGDEQPEVADRPLTWNELVARIGEEIGLDPVEAADPNLERAIIEVVGGRLTLREAAKKYRIGDKRLSAELRERGITLTRGRRRRRKDEEES